MNIQQVITDLRRRWENAEQTPDRIRRRAAYKAEHGPNPARIQRAAREGSPIEEFGESPEETGI